MSEEIIVLDPWSSCEWMQFVHAHPAASIFHHPAWMRVIRATYGYPMFVACVKRDGKICSALPFAEVRSSLTGYRLVSLPFSDHCAPLVCRNDATLVERLTSFARSHCSQAESRVELHAEIRELPASHLEQHYVVHTLDLTKEPSELFASFDRRTAQRSIGIAEKKRVVVKECRTKAEFELFYSLHLKTRKRLGVPVQPKALFDNIWQHMLMPGVGFALIAFNGDTPIGGGVFFTFNKTVVFKYSASDMKYKSLQPSHAFIWRAMQTARERGCTTFDFGRTDRSHEQLRRFKNSWNATEHDLNYTVITDRPRPERLSKLQTALGHIIRHSPEFVCRLSGEVLYKHFA
jgi:lipid II:glycine glycyltransferase (peptidoglycan interpeptide bridge formation enzyme)